MVANSSIDQGRLFDCGRTSLDYAKYRDIYPAVFYEKIAAENLCIKGQKVLDLGTGSGVLPRNMYHYGAGETKHPIEVNSFVTDLFESVYHEEISDNYA